MARCRHLAVLLCLVTCTVLVLSQAPPAGHAPNDDAAEEGLRSLQHAADPRRSPVELGLMAAAAAGALLLLPPPSWAQGGAAADRAGLASLSEFVMTRVDKGLEKFPSIPSLDPQECMKRSVCEAHNQPNKYGLVGLALQLLYPPYSAPEEPTAVVSKYQLAARYGRQEDADCSRQYDGCIVSPLEIVQTIVGYFLR
ncbi:uncharacterized protein [Dermacentor albipictus]|uniref:uncharacterized protein n=1 Tax=Dermacentor albipictus TaxID=60249 RepID=UPI0038FBE63E